MRAERLLFTICLVSVFIVQSITIVDSTVVYRMDGTCHPGYKLWVYPIIATIMYGIGYVLSTIRYNSSSLLNFATALLVIPFVDRVIQPCHLALITYATIEYSLRSLRTAAKTKSDMGRIVMAELLKAYIYIGYVHIDSIYDDYHTVTLYIVLDVMFTTFGCILTSLQINVEGGTGTGRICLF